MIRHFDMKRRDLTDRQGIERNQSALYPKRVVLSIQQFDDGLHLRQFLVRAIDRASGDCHEAEAAFGGSRRERHLREKRGVRDERKRSRDCRRLKETPGPDNSQPENQAAHAQPRPET